MPMLRPCPRCTQVLPASAAFCRRCGAAVEASFRHAAVSPPTKPGSLISASLVAMLLCALVFSGFVIFRVQSQPTAVQVNPGFYSPPEQFVQPVFPRVTYPVYPMYPVSPRYPDYPVVGAPPGSAPYPDRDDRHQGR